MKFEQSITSSNPTAQVTLTFPPDALTVMNNTPYSLFIRRGTASLPNRETFDYIVPAGIYTTLPVIGQEFGFALDIDASETPYFRMPAQIIFTRDETLPVFSSAVYRESASRQQVISGGNTDEFIVSTRGARGLYVEISRLTTPPQPDRGINVLACDVLTGQLGNTRISGLINNGWGSDVTRRVLAVADDIVQLRVTNLTTSDVSYVIKWTLLDAYTPLTAKYTTITPQRLMSVPPGDQENVYVTTTQMSGIVRALSVVVATATPDEDFAVRLSAGLGLVSANIAKSIFLSNVRSFPLTNIPAGWEYGRAAAYFAERTEHPDSAFPYATRYILPMNVHVPRLFDINVFNDDTISPGTLNVYIQAHIDLEIAG